MDDWSLKKERRLIRNRARCKVCGDVMESTHRHDFHSCSCGNLAVDGGLAYVRRVYREQNSYEELSEYAAD